jgi:hypothetical protein
LRRLTGSKSLSNLATNQPGDRHTFQGSTETALTLNTFLTLVTTGEVDFGKGTSSDLIKLVHLGQFIRKYDCKDAHASLSHHLKFALNNRRICPSFGFIIASVIDNAETADVALKKRGSFWENIPGAVTPGPLKAEFDISGWPLFYFRLVGSPDYLYALSQAFNESKNDYGNLPVKFSSHLAKAKAGKSWPHLTCSELTSTEKLL